MSAQYSVEALDLTKRFGEFTAVDRVSFRVSPGEVFGFLGPNGSGKTTTIRMLCGILPPTSGVARVLGYDVTRFAETIKGSIGYMSQRFSMYEDLTAWENLEFYASVYSVPRETRRARIEELIAMAGLAGRENEPAGQLSGGWRQRLALACAIVHRPPILFLDEPTAGVDPASRRSFWELIYELSTQGVTVFVTTHYMDEAEHCHTIALMHSGRLVAIDTPERMRAESIRGDLLEVDCDDASLAVDVLSQEGDLSQVALYGPLVHVVVGSASDGSARVASLLEHRGIGVRRIERVMPTLEDAFVALIGREREAQSTERRAGG